MSDQTAVKLLIIYIAMESTSAQRVVDLWQAGDKDVLAKAREMGIVRMEIAGGDEPDQS